VAPLSPDFAKPKDRQGDRTQGAFGAFIFIFNQTNQLSSFWLET
jgi:hypothetical protein